MTATLTPGRATLTTLRKIARDKLPFDLDPACRAGVDASRKVVEDILHHDAPVCQAVLPAKRVLDPDNDARKSGKPHEKIKGHHERDRSQREESPQRDGNSERMNARFDREESSPESSKSRRRQRWPDDHHGGFSQR